MARSLEGLLLLNLLFLVAGSCVLWPIRAWSDWSTYVAETGVAYLSGVAIVCVGATLVLVSGGGLSTAAILVLTLAPAVAGVSAGVLAGRSFPRLGDWSWVPRRRGDAATLVFVGVSAAVLFELARVMRTQALTSWDAWAFWVPKAKAIYYFGGLDEQMFREIAAQNYPLLVPALQAMDFRFMGSPDVVTLGIQYWLLLVGFVLAAAALLRGLAPAWLTWIFLASVVAMPELDHRLPERIADWPLDFFFALAVLVLARLLVTQERWLLAFAGFVLAAMLATKREGQIYALALVIGALAAAGLRRKRLGLAVLGVAAAAYAVNIPWRIWWSSRHLWSDVPPGGLIHATFQWSRVLPSLALAVRVSLSYSLWHLALPVAVVGAVAALFGARRDVALLFLVCTGAMIVGIAWATWSTGIPITDQPALNPTPRASGSLALASLLLTPILVSASLAGERWRLLLPQRLALRNGVQVPAD